MGPRPGTAPVTVGPPLGEIAMTTGETAADDDQVRGITRREHITWLLFRALARGDFHHDFGENVVSRDKFVKEDENRFFEIAKRVSKKGSVELRTTFKRYVGSNLFKLITDRIDTILPEGDRDKIKAGPGKGTAEEGIFKSGVAPTMFAKEDDILGLIGLDWKQLKVKIAEEDPGVLFEDTFAKSVVEGGRTYQIRACPYRLGERGSDEYNINTAPIDALGVVTGGKTNFALIVDASGGLPLSELRYRDLIKGAGGGTVYIIENIENRSDSATKLLPPALKPKPKNAAEAADFDKRLRPAPDLKFLRDNVNTINYPLWQASGDQKSNIYSSLFIILNRISEDNIEANLVLQDEKGKTLESYSIGDVANASNVKNASLYALALILEKGRVTNEALVYTLIKRMGDWCQALSLLDLDREYTIYTEDGKPQSAGGGQTGGANKTTTLRQLQATTEIGVVTNDRILLALCILLGLNVFYTSAMDIARLIYFKNTRDLPTGPALKEVVDALIEKIPRADVAGIRARIAAHEDAILAARDDFITKRILAPPFQKSPLGTNNIADYILALRSLLSNLGRLRLDFAPSVAQIEANAAIALPPPRDPDAPPPVPPSESSRLTAANIIISVLAKIDLDIKYNESVLADLQDPENRSVDGKERIRLAALKQKLSLGIRIPKSVEVTEATVILSQTRNDILQILGKQAPLLVREMFRTTPAEFDIGEESRSFVNYQELLSVFPPIMNLIPGLAGGQRGGAVDDIDEGYKLLRTRSIRVLPPLPSTSSAVLPPSGDEEEAAPVGVDDEVTSTINIHRIGAFYYDESLNPYTVADEYIITKADLPIFKKVFDGLPKTVPNGVTPNKAIKLLYVCNRYLLLLLDIAWNDVDGMTQEAVEAGGDGVVDPSNEKALVKNSGVFEQGTYTRTRINQIIDTVTQAEQTLAAGVAAGPDGTENPAKLVEFVNGAVTLYLNPPTGEETRPYDGLEPIQSRILECRTQLLANIETFVGGRGTEYGQTVEIETTIATNYDNVNSIVISRFSYTKYVEPIVQRVLTDLWLFNARDGPIYGPRLREVVKATIADAVAEVAGAAQEGVIGTAYNIGSFPEDFVDTMVEAIEEWALTTVPPQNPTEWDRFYDMLKTVRTRIKYIWNEEKKVVDEAVAAAEKAATEEAAAEAYKARLKAAKMEALDAETGAGVDDDEDEERTAPSSSGFGVAASSALPGRTPASSGFGSPFAASSGFGVATPSALPGRTPASSGFGVATPSALPGQAPSPFATPSALPGRASASSGFGVATPSALPGRASASSGFGSPFATPSGWGAPTGLYAGTGTASNASTPFGYSRRGGRRRLYEGLRKRGGEGGAPEL
jgi:hypothetical protein